jgi:Protein of unknown function (DUF3667)
LSHPKERKEKVCLSCGATLYGRYCHLCGQENIEPKESAWSLVTHFFYDITHFDGKFFSTVKYLLIRPGFLSREYMLGRRAKYLNPVRLYVFTSAFFFLILFALLGGVNGVQINTTQSIGAKVSLADLRGQRARIQDSLTHPQDGVRRNRLAHDLKNTDLEISVIKGLYGDSTKRQFDKSRLASLATNAELDSESLAAVPAKARLAIQRSILEGEDSSETNLLFESTLGKFNSVESYDSAQQKLPKSQRDGLLQTALNERIVAMNADIRNDKQAFGRQIWQEFSHSFPKILFVSLPFFALILKFLYIRRRQYYYVDHGIFTIHLYCAFFIALFFWFLLYKVHHLISAPWFGTLRNILDWGLFLYMVVYLYKAMRKFYLQGRAKTLVKYALVCLLGFLLDLTLFIVFLVISVISVA